MAANDCYTISVHLHSAGVEATIRVHYRETVSSNAVSPASVLSTQWSSDHMTLLRNCLSSKVFVTRIEVRQWLGDIRPPSLASAANVEGNVAGDALPMSLAALIELRQAQFSTRLRGRVYLPGLPEAEVSGQSVTNPLRVKLGLLANRLAQGVTASPSTGGGTWQPVVKRRLPGPPGQPIYAPVPIVFAQAQTVLCRQRRRRNFTRAPFI